MRHVVEYVRGDRFKRSHSLRNKSRDPFFSIVGICNSGLRDGAVHHDRDIYGIHP